uniref:LRRCT domain-containing protein n=1 Tax=Clastoptera arizonana TaxID=38151 RepID=A0A1B6C1M7_9HEMI
MYLKSIPEHMFHTPRFLEVLNISSNLFTSVPIEIEETHNLKELILDDNPIASIKEFPRLDHLEVLHLSWMPNLVSIESRSLSSLKNLKELNCSHNLLLHSIDGTALTSANEEGEIWPPIIKLFLNNNKLGYLDSQLLMQWERVMYLNIQNNPWICDCNNQWLVSDLIPLLKKSNSKFMVDGIVCHEPTEMRGKSFIDLHHRNYFMRCLDKYGRQPEKDATVLVGVLIGVLLAIPLTAIGFILYKRQNQTSKQYSRAFYKAADVNQVFTET